MNLQEIALEALHLSGEVRAELVRRNGHHSNQVTAKLSLGYGKFLINLNQLGFYYDAGRSKQIGRNYPAAGSNLSTQAHDTFWVSDLGFTQR